MIALPALKRWASLARPSGSELRGIRQHAYLRRVPCPAL